MGFAASSVTVTSAGSPPKVRRAIASQARSSVVIEAIESSRANVKGGMPSHTGIASRNS